MNTAKNTHRAYSALVIAEDGSESTHNVCVDIAKLAAAAERAGVEIGAKRFLAEHLRRHLSAKAVRMGHGTEVVGKPDDSDEIRPNTSNVRTNNRAKVARLGEIAARYERLNTEKANA